MSGVGGGSRAQRHQDPTIRRAFLRPNIWALHSETGLWGQSVSGMENVIALYSFQDCWNEKPGIYMDFEYSDRGAGHGWVSSTEKCGSISGPPKLVEETA